jgi:hypothetical protein
MNQHQSRIDRTTPPRYPSARRAIKQRGGEVGLGGREGTMGSSRVSVHTKWYWSTACTTWKVDTLKENSPVAAVDACVARATGGWGGGCR